MTWWKTSVVGAIASGMLLFAGCSNRAGDQSAEADLGTGGSGEAATVEEGGSATVQEEPGTGGSGTSTTDAASGTTEDADEEQQAADPNSWDSSTRTSDPTREDGAGTGGSGEGNEGSLIEDDASGGGGSR